MGDEEDDVKFTPIERPGSVPAAQKTPISLLQELCARHSLTPDYKLLSVEGVVHAPTFMYRVEVGSVVATATGQSKKKAKHSAAKVILEKLLSSEGIFGKTTLEDGTTVDDTNFTSVMAEPSNRASPQEDGVPGNPVGGLQEMCMKRRWRPPYYETVSVQGLPHERVFGITCNVRNINKTGIGKSKRLAKRQAAYLIIKEIEELDKQEEEADGYFDDDNPKPSFEAGSGDLKDGLQGLEAHVRSGPSIPNHSLTVSKFVEKMSQSTALSQRENTDPSDTDIELLEEIGRDHDFAVLFFNLQKPGLSGKHYCLVQLGSVPVAVCYGNGMSPKEAKEVAAHSALQFLRLLTQKS